MNVKQDQIPGIYNFCDSWCERCLFTQRCHSYQIQAENGLNQQKNSQDTIVQQLTEALTLTRQYIGRLQKTNASDELPATEKQALEQKALPDTTTKHPVAQLTHVYLRQSGDWLRDEKGLLEQAGHQQLHEVRLGIRSEAEALLQLNALKDAWEMVRWYRTLIPIKTLSALRLFNETADDARLTDYYVGKAKLVLVSIDRSLLAWQTVMTYYPDKTDELLDILVLLNHISRDLEALFPDARAFQRPGLD